MHSKADGRGHLLYSLALQLQPTSEALISPTQGYHAYALFLQMLQWRDPEFSNQLHEKPGPKPFTISPLQGKTVRRGGNVLVSPAETYWLRVTVLQEDVFARLLDALIQLPKDRDLRLETTAFRLRQVVTVPGQSPWANFSSYDTLLNQATPQRRITITFLSPTAFRSGGQRNIALPLPGLVFGSLLARWNEFAPEPLPESLRQQAEEGLMIARYRLETRIQDFGRYKEMGFEGECEYEVTPSLPGETARQLAALADFAYFAGVGAKTTMGMGQAWRAENGRPLSSRAGSDAP